MLSIEDLQLIVKVLSSNDESEREDYIRSNRKKITNLVKRLNILLEQDSFNREYQEKMIDYKKQLDELTKEETIEK